MNHLILPFLLAAAKTAHPAASSAHPTNARTTGDPVVEAVLPALISGLKLYLADPRSIQDMIVCAPDSPDQSGGDADTGNLQFALNARSRGGAYQGLTPFSARYHDGVVDNIEAFGGPDPSELAMSLRLVVLDALSRCQSVPQARVQQLLESTPALAPSR